MRPSYLTRLFQSKHFRKNQIFKERSDDEFKRSPVLEMTCY